MQLKLILKDGTGIELEEASYTQHYVVSCKDAKAFQRIWNKLTDENLSEIQITEEGNTVHTIIGSSLEGSAGSRRLKSHRSKKNERRADMEEYITRPEHDAFSELMKSENSRLKEEDARQNKRLSALETAIQQINALTVSVERLAASVENMAKEQLQINKSIEKQGERIGSLENRDGEKWRQVTGYVLTTIIGIVLGFIATHIGV